MDEELFDAVVIFRVANGFKAHEADNQGLIYVAPEKTYAFESWNSLVMFLRERLCSAK